MVLFPRISRVMSLACGVAVGASAMGMLLRKSRDQEGVGTKSEPNGLSLLFNSGNGTRIKWDSNWDRRSPESLVKPNKKKKWLSKSNDENNNADDLQSLEATALRHLFLIRHGNYNMDGTGDDEHRLTPLGKEQSELTGQRLVELGLPYTALVHSSQKRAIETAQIIRGHLAEDLPTEQSDLLREGYPIAPEPPCHWKQDYKIYSEGARIEAAFRKYFHRAPPKQTKDSYELIVCHANVIRYFVCRALQLPPEAWLRMSLNHASITWLTVYPSGRVSLRALGDSGHMPPTKLSRS